MLYVIKKFQGSPATATRIFYFHFLCHKRAKKLTILLMDKTIVNTKSRYKNNLSSNIICKFQLFFRWILVPRQYTLRSFPSFSHVLKFHNDSTSMTIITDSSDLMTTNIPQLCHHCVHWIQQQLFFLLVPTY